MFVPSQASTSSTSRHVPAGRVTCHDRLVPIHGSYFMTYLLHHCVYRVKPGFHPNAIAAANRILGRSSGNHDWLLANASDCVWMETGLELTGHITHSITASVVNVNANCYCRRVLRQRS